ncbi:cell wall protein DAN4 isoform X2 [Camponotus floridanus]|uniref:cell wall protein DAN4 isoform X2 n=1 Tax=Camponotus floridanus TaxID=104421 RepID=UPI000DC69097|nr:cell wall protein DAN4 isoform X2 [Camponotus floridanus]
MQPLGVLLLLLSCQLATPKPIFDRDGADLLHREYRSAGFGETIRDWFRIIKNRVVGKWQEWFGNDDPPTPSFSPQDIFNIDKTIGNRVPGYPSLFLDLFTGNDDDSSDSDSDEWDMRSLLPNLPSFPTLGIDWTPNIHEFEIPKTTQLPMTTPKIKLTTPKIELTTPQQTPQTNIQTESVLTESTVILTEPIPFTTQLIATSTEPVVTSTEEILTSTESSVTNDESDTISTESILTSTETIPVSIESTVPSTESVVTSTELITSSTDTTLDSTESIVTSIESVVTVTESIETLTEEIATSTITELSDPTSTEVILPVLNKRIEDNETVNTRTTKKPRPASAEVIMF